MKATSHSPVVRSYDREPWRETAASATTWWAWALPLILLGLAGYLYARRYMPPPPPTVVPKIERPSDVNTGFVDKTLRNATTLHVPADGVESRLIAFIEDPNQKVDKNSWFSFDRLEFETDSATLKTSSNEQLRNIATILKAYHQVRVKIGGYTDNVGNDSYNLKLSSERAINTKNAIADLGIEWSRLSSEGYGNNYPVADNSTEEGQQRNRRIDIRVTEK